MRSPDLAHWEHCPIAIMPTPGSYDGAGCWSGSVVIHNGVPTMMYSGVADMTLFRADDDLPPSDRQRIPQGYYHEFVLEIDQETQCIATSDDSMTTWDKHPANPVIPSIPEDLDLIGFRDPFSVERRRRALVHAARLRHQEGGWRSIALPLTRPDRMGIPKSAVYRRSDRERYQLGMSQFSRLGREAHAGRLASWPSDLLAWGLC